MKKELLDKKMKELRKNAISPTEYRSRITERVIQKQTLGDFRKSQKICEFLDTEKVRIHFCNLLYFPKDSLNGQFLYFRVSSNHPKNGFG